MAEIIDGKRIAAEIRAEVAEAVAKLGERNVTPGLAVVLVGDDPASAVYVRMKAKACEEAGILSRVIQLPADTEQAELERTIDGLNADDFRKVVLERFDMSLGNGLGKVAGKVFRIGHLGDFNELMLAGTLFGVEKGLRLFGVNSAQGGVDAAMDYLDGA